MQIQLLSNEKKKTQGIVSVKIRSKMKKITRKINNNWNVTR